MTRPRLTIAAPYAVLCAVVIAGYPTLRGEALLWLYTGAELAGAGFAGWCYVRWRKLSGLRSRSMTSSTFCALTLISTAGAVSLWTALRGLGLIVEQWPAVQGAWCVTLAVVVVVQGRELAR
jgi:hypothetical protein